MKYQDKGFSLLEVIIAAGLLGAISLGVMQLTKNMQTGQKTVELKGEKMDFANRMKLYLSSDKSCAATLGGRSVANNTDVYKIKVHREPSDVTILDLKNPDPKLGGYQFGDGAARIRVTKIFVDSYSKTQDVDANTEEGTIDLVFELEKASTSKEGTYGASSFTEKLPLQVYVTKSNQTIWACSDPTGGAKASCDSLGGTMQMNAAGNVTCSRLHLTNPGNQMGLKLTNESNGTNVRLRPDELTLSHPENGTAMHIRSWGSSTDIESMNGPLVFNNKTVNQKVWNKDPVTGEITESTQNVDGRVQIGDYVPGDTNTLYVGGTIFAVGNISTNEKVFAGGIELSSDLRLKENIQSLNFKLENFLKIPTYSFSYAHSKDESHSGFIAQDVLKDFPQLVGQRADGFLTVKSIEMIPYLLELIKQQELRIKKLEENLLKK